MEFKKGTKVRFVDYREFTEGNRPLVLGASLLDDLGRVTGEKYGEGDVGTVAFPHPNRQLCPDWFYVEVNSKERPGEKRYVGVVPSMVEAIP